MSWITIIWSMASAMCVTLALIHLTIWFERRSQVVHLLFALTALGAAGNAVAELGMLKATTVEAYATALRISFVPLVLLAIAMAWYVRSYFGTGRRSLAVAVTIAWLLVLIIDAFSPFSPIFSEISGLRIVQTPWGETFALAKGVIHPLNLVISVADLIFLVFVVDASAAFWRRGERRRAVFLGIGIVGGSLVAVVVARMIDFGVLQMPYVTTFVYIGIIVVFGYPLTLDVVRTAQLARQLQDSEAELRESEARINLAATAANLGLWLWNIRDDELWVTKQWRRLFGFAESEPVSFDRVLQVVHPEDRERTKQLVQQMFEGGGGEYENEYRITRPDGSTRWMAGHGSVELDERGKPAFVRGVSHDITKRKMAEEKLRESEGRFRAVADAAPVLIWMSGTDKLCTFFNKSWLEFTGRTMEQEMGNGWAEGVHPEDFQQCLQTYVAAFDARQPFVMEYRLRRHDGEYRWISDNGVPRYDAQKNFAGYIGSCMDITERRQAEEKFRLVVEASPSGIILVNDRGRIALVNSQTEKLFGYGREELVGKPVEILVPERFASRHPDHRGEFLGAPTARAMGAGRELFARRKDGSEFPVEIGLNPIQTPDGILVLAAVLDISARKLAEAEAVQHREELGHLSRVAVTGELAASIAHELNQPLSAIISNASAGQRFIEGGHVDLSELRELLADIVADGRRAGDVIRGVQNMVRKRTPARQRVNLNDLVTSVVRMVNGNAILHSCEVETLLDANLPAIQADPIQLQQVLLNLMINAFEAMRDIPISRRKVVIATERNGHDTICASVRDYGPGIPEEARERIFDHFFTTKAEGLGMGLAIVRSIVESHAGRIAAENAKGGGACFRFTVPASAAAL